MATATTKAQATLAQEYQIPDPVTSDKNAPKGTWLAASLVTDYFQIEYRTQRQSTWRAPASRPRRLMRQRIRLAAFYAKLGTEVISEQIVPRERAGKAVWEA